MSYVRIARVLSNGPSNREEFPTRKWRTHSGYEDYFLFSIGVQSIAQTGAIDNRVLFSFRKECLQSSELRCMMHHKKKKSGLSQSTRTVCMCVCK